MFFLTSIFIWAFLGVAVFLKFYYIYEASPDAFARGRISLSITVMANNGLYQANGPDAAPAMVLFHLPQTGPSETYLHSEPSLEDMLEIADDIFDLYNSQEEFDNDEITQFVGHLQDDNFRGNSRYVVPRSVSRGFHLAVADVMLYRQWLHPNWKRSRVVVVRISGDRTGKIQHLAWNRVEAQKCFLEAMPAGQRTCATPPHVARR